MGLHWIIFDNLKVIKFQREKMPQSGVGSMQGSNERTHTRGGRTHNVTQRTDTHIFTEGGDAPTIYPNERTHTFSQGGTHPQGNPTNGHTNFF